MNFLYVNINVWIIFIALLTISIIIQFKTGSKKERKKELKEFKERLKETDITPIQLLERIAKLPSIIFEGLIESYNHYKNLLIGFIINYIIIIYVLKIIQQYPEQSSTYFFLSLALLIHLMAWIG